MTRHGATLAVVALLALAAASCGDGATTASDDSGGAASSPSAATLDDLDGRVFATDAVTSPDHTLVDGTQVRMAFRGSDVSAHAGCNHLSGTAAIDDGTLVVDRLAGTEMGCEQPLADQDAWLQEFLAGAPSAELDGETLTLTSGDTTLELTEAEVPGRSGDPDQATDDGGVTGTVVE